MTFLPPQESIQKTHLSWCIPNDRPEAKVTKTSLLVDILLGYASPSHTQFLHQKQLGHTRLTTIHARFILERTSYISTRKFCRGSGVLLLSIPIPVATNIYFLRAGISFRLFAQVAVQINNTPDK